MQYCHFALLFPFLELGFLMGCFLKAKLGFFLLRSTVGISKSYFIRSIIRPEKWVFARELLYLFEW